MKKEPYGNQDEKEKARELTEAEQKRLERFENLSEEMIRQGYRRTELTIGIKKANAFTLLLLIPLSVIGVGLYLLVNKSLNMDISNGKLANLALFLLAFLVLTVLHELIHGISWAIFTPHHFKDIEFGIMKQYLTPYCTCSVPLSKGQYIFGAVMPLILLGIVPMIVGICIGSFPVLLIGILMADGAGGDIMIIRNILRYRTEAREVTYIDHPTQAGGVIFER